MSNCVTSSAPASALSALYRPQSKCFLLSASGLTRQLQLTGDLNDPNKVGGLRSFSLSEIMLQLLLSALLFVPHLQNAPQGDGFIRALEYMKKTPETLDELMTRNYALAEGDLVLSNDKNAVQSVWPTHDIAYLISKELAHRTKDILSGMAMLSEHTCLSFHERTSETNYLLFKDSKGCASYVGFRGGEQPVFMGPPCIVGNIAHEILHALGFQHEHTRMDREEHITVMSHNIMSGMEKNFQKKSGETFGLPYDITSIMHYGSAFFSANHLPTIVSKGEETKMRMGQRDRLTERDIERVARLYGCDVTKSK
uniref:Metalloendopeptidase n=1 Tax=Labrus bergylta TaxID=56723 RepID=A0A3Q3EQZ9_9LABR